MAGIVWLLQRAFGKANRFQQKKIDQKEKDQRKSLKKQAQLNPSDHENIKQWAKMYGEKKQESDAKYKTERTARVKAARLQGRKMRKNAKPSEYMAKDPTPKKKKLKEETLIMNEKFFKYLTGKVVKESSEAEKQLPQDIQDYNAKVREQETSLYVRQLERAAELADATNPFEAARLRALATEAMKSR